MKVSEARPLLEDLESQRVISEETVRHPASVQHLHLSPVSAAPSHSPADGLGLSQSTPAAGVLCE